MVINEIFPNPTVEQVIFQIRYPNLFFIEKNIGDIQIKIMEKFPESGLLLRKKFMLAELSSGEKIPPVDDEVEEGGKKIWQFTAENGTQLNITTDSLDLTSRHYKTYNKENGDKFRDIIEFVLEQFFSITRIPNIRRIGLRYIDKCPLPEKENETLTNYYNTVFPIERFGLDRASEMNFRTTVSVEDFYLRYIEALSEEEGNYFLKLDFDGFANNIKSTDCLEVTDRLHRIISDEYENTIKEPVYQYMREDS